MEILLIKFVRMLRIHRKKSIPYKKCSDVGLKDFKDPKAFIKYPSDIQDVYNSTDE